VSVTHIVCPQKLLTFKGITRVEVDSSLLVDGQMRGANMRRWRGSVVLGDLGSDHLLAASASGARVCRKGLWRLGDLCNARGHVVGCCEAQSLPRQAMRCSPEERRPTGAGVKRLAFASNQLWYACEQRPWSTLRRTGGEGDERVSTPENVGSGWGPLDSDTRRKYRVQQTKAA